MQIHRRTLLIKDHQLILFENNEAESNILLRKLRGSHRPTIGVEKQGTDILLTLYTSFVFSETIKT
jgi:hypothetical protein